MAVKYCDGNTTLICYNKISDFILKMKRKKSPSVACFKMRKNNTDKFSTHHLISVKTLNASSFAKLDKIGWFSILLAKKFENLILIENNMQNTMRSNRSQKKCLHTIVKVF